MKNIINSFTILLIGYTINISAQETNCSLPGHYDYINNNTGNNMTVFLTNDFFNSITVSDPNAYIAIMAGDLLVGSVNVYGINQTSISVWGDDSATPEIDGATLNENVSFKLIDGYDIYDINNSVNVPYILNGTPFLGSPSSIDLNCSISIVNGCTDASATNFNANANNDDGSCYIGGCMQIEANNYNSSATQDDGSCVIEGCTSSSACNFNVNANNDNGSCTYEQTGYDCDGICLLDSDSDGVCDGFEVQGCMQSDACNYNELATDSGYCTYPTADYLDCNGDCVNDQDYDGICDIFEVTGCTDPTATNFNSSATDDDGSCIATILGCTNSQATNYNSNANTDNGSCQILGCMDNSAYNYEPNATVSDGNCEDIINGCTDSNSANFNSNANTDDGSCIEIVNGCTDAVAYNFNTNANTDDGSCEYLTFDGNWPSTPAGLPVTGNNSTVALNTSNLNLNNGDYLGAFYETNGSLVCGGMLIWDTDTTNQLIVLWGDDEYSGTQNGFNSGDEVVWISRNNSTLEETYLYPYYSTGNNNYMTNAAYIIDSWLVNPQFGCTDPAFQEYDSNAILDDGTCSTLFSSLYSDQGDSLASLELELDSLNSDFNELNTNSQTTIFNMQTSYDSLQLASNQNYFNLNSSLTDSLNLVHQYYENLVDSMNNDVIDSLDNDIIQLTQDLQDTLVYIEQNLQVTIDSVELKLDSIKLDTTLLAQNLADSILYFSSYVQNLNASNNSTIVGLQNQISNMLNEYQNVVQDYENQINQINLTHNNTMDSLNIVHSENLTAANFSFDSLGDILNLTVENYLLDSTNLEFAYQSQISSINFSYQDTITEFINEDLIEDYAFSNHIDSLKEDSTFLSNNYLSTDNLLNLTRDSLNLALTHELNLLADSSYLQQNFDYHSAPIDIDLAQGWNMVGYTLKEPMNTAASLQELGNDLHLIKDNYANVYWPEFGFSSLENLTPGQGYQIRMYNAYNNYTFPDVGDQRIALVPDVPDWVNDVIPIHPNDIKTLITVVNMLGQEVDPKNQQVGETLLYLYNDGSVDKIIK